MGQSKQKILCVDDETFVLDALSRVLRKDFEVLIAENAEKALQILSEVEGVDIVLSDFRMPGMDGIQFLKEVKKRFPEVVRAILSGQMDSQQIATALNENVLHRYILKPWDNEYLRIQMLEASQRRDSIAERKRLYELSIKDPVTGLTNHRYFQEQLHSQLTSAKENSTNLSLLMIDVDFFKSFNDRYGHPEGDRLLATISDNIKSNVGLKGSVSRYGGEEFAVLLPNYDSESAFAVAEQIRTAIEDQAFLGPFGRPAYITVSVGLASFPDHADNAESLLLSADKALYEAKKKGRNQTSQAK